MVAKSNILNVNRLLLLLLFSLAFFNLLVHAKTFEISNKIKSAKAIVGTDKKIDGSVTFDPADYNPTRQFVLTVSKCKLGVEATKDSRNNVDFIFFNGDNRLGSVPNPKSFLVQEQSLTFYHSNGDSGPMSCDKSIKFIPMEKDPKKLTVEFKLEGDVPENFALTSNYLSYDESAESEKDKANVTLWICIGVGGLLFLLLIISSVVGGVCIFIKCRKKNASKEMLKTAKELSKQEPTKDQLSAKSTKPAKKTPKAKETQKVSVRDRETQAKPVSEVQPQTETMKPKSVEVEEKRSKVEEKLDPNDPFNKISDPDRRRWVRQCVQMMLEEQRQWDAKQAAKERERKEREAMKTAKEEKELSKTQTVEKTAEEKTMEEDKTQTLVSKTQTQVDKTQENKSR